jgi:hypothetical protein
VNFRFQQKTGDLSTGAQETSVAGKIGITLVFFVFFAMGMLFEVLLIREIARNVISRSWPQVSCTILESSVSDDSSQSSPYRFAVKYQYIYQDKTWQSERYRLQNTNFSDYQAAQKLVNTYPIGAVAICYVNPQNPAEAILRHSSLGLAFFIFLPTVFVLIGGGGIYGTWFSKKKKAPDGTALREPKGGINQSKWILVLFGLVFFAAGAGISYPLLVRPLWNSYLARSWIEMPCKVISARVLSHESHGSHGGTTYSIDILYEYVVNDIPHRSNCYDFISGSSSGYNGKQEIVNRYRSMKEPVCYVNPANPSDAVLMRNITWENAIGLFPLIFVAAGLFVMRMGISKIVKSATLPPDQQWLPQAVSKSHSTSDFQHGYDIDFGDKIILKPQTPTWNKLIGILFFCLFWNGIVSVFVINMISGFRSGRPEWFLVFFLIPFELVGVGTIVAVVYQFLAIFNPQFHLTIQPGNLYPGSEGQISWAVRGRAQRIRSLSIKLIGREEATYRQGKNTGMDKTTFFEKELINTGMLQEITAGQAKVSIPQETMHSFESDNNKIVWLIELRGDITRWPDVSQEYKITIYPKAIV